MSTVYSARFLNVGAGVSGTSRTVPAGRVWVIKSARVLNHSGATGVGAAITGAGNFLICGSAYPDQGEPLISSFYGMYVMYAGEVLTLVVSGGSWDAQASGYDLQA